MIILKFAESVVYIIVSIMKIFYIIVCHPFHFFFVVISKKPLLLDGYDEVLSFTEGIIFNVFNNISSK